MLILLIEITHMIMNASQKVCGDSMVDEGLVIQEKAVVKASVIGKECSLGSNSNIANSIVMPQTLIGKKYSIFYLVVTNINHSISKPLIFQKIQNFI